MKTPGTVYIKWNSLEMIVCGDYEYPVDLERCTTASQLLDYLFQIAAKPWCDAALLKNIFDCLEAACQKKFKTNLQRVFCPFGRDMRVDWKNGTFKDAHQK